MAKSIALMKVRHNQEQFAPDFYDWLTKNYALFSYFEDEALAAYAAGFGHYSARTIWEVMRHRTNIREIGDGTWKLNDHRSPDLARLYLLMHPGHKGFFELRGRKAA